MKKRILSLLLASILLATLFGSFPTTVQADTVQNMVRVIVNGTEHTTGPQGFLQNDRTMVPLRMIAEDLGYEVSWDEESRAVTLQKGENTLLLTVDQNVYRKNGEEKEFDAAPFIKEDRTFVPIRLVAEEFGASVEWNGEYRIVKITQLLDADTIDLSRLVDWKILSAEDLKKDGNLTVGEALSLLYRLEEGYEPYWDYASEVRWGMEDDLRPMNDLAEETKALLLGVWLRLLNTQELSTVDLDSTLTESDALKYIIRLIGNTYSCTDDPMELEYQTAEEIYGCAKARGIIPQDYVPHENAPIGRAEVYQLLYRALRTPVTFGGYAAAYVTTWADILDRRIERQAESEE